MHPSLEVLHQFKGSVSCGGTCVTWPQAEPFAFLQVGAFPLCPRGGWQQSCDPVPCPAVAPSWLTLLSWSRSLWFCSESSWTARVFSRSASRRCTCCFSSSSCSCFTSLSSSDTLPSHSPSLFSNRRRSSCFSCSRCWTMGEKRLGREGIKVNVSFSSSMLGPNLVQERGWC